MVKVTHHYIALYWPRRMRQCPFFLRLELVLSWLILDYSHLYMNLLGLDFCRKYQLFFHFNFILFYRAMEQFLRQNPNYANLKKDDGYTALHLASLNDHLDIVTTLAENVSITQLSIHLSHFRMPVKLIVLPTLFKLLYILQCIKVILGLLNDWLVLVLI